MKKMSKMLYLCVILAAVCLTTAPVEASSSYGDGMFSLLNPFNPANRSVQMAVERSLRMGMGLNHNAAMSSFTSPSVFMDYSFGKNDDKRAGGFDNYFNSYTLGADAYYNDTTLWGLMVNYTDEQGSNGAVSDEIDTWATTLYMSRSLSDNVFWGSSFTYANGDSHINGAGTTDTDSFVIAPYLTMLTRMDDMTLSLSPSYVLGYQRSDYPTGANPDDDEALMGKLLLMGRASVPVSETMTLTGNLDFNQVLHNHGLDNETDPDHQWFTTGVTLNYTVNENISGSLGYTTAFDSDFNSEIVSVGLTLAF